MRIAICDDDTTDRKHLVRLVEQYCNRHSLDARVEEFAAGAPLLRRMNQTPYAVVFMDIYLERENGVDVAKTMRQRKEDCVLFFATISDEFALDGFAVGARHYLVKPIAYNHVETAMDRCGDRLVSMARTLQLSSKWKNRVVVGDILYVEVLNKTCFIHTAEQVDTTRKSIAELERELGGLPFLRCHRSFIVNLEQVQDYDKTDFILRNGMRVPIRQAGRNRIKQTYRDYLALKVSELV